MAVGFFFVLGLCTAFSQETEPAPETPRTPTLSERILEVFKLGKFECGVFFSLWTVDFLKGLLEGEVFDELGQEIRDEVTKEIRESHPDLGSQEDFTQDFLFDSGGRNFGLEIRYYPQGREGSFSLGLSFEKARMRLSIDGSVRQDFTDGSYATADAFGHIELHPLFTTLSFRWDIKPAWRVSPFFIIGIGIAALKGEVSYDYSGLYNWTGNDEAIGDSEVMDFLEAEEDASINIPNILPLLQMDFGVRAEIIPHLIAKAELGFWNGFMIRGGVAGRF